MCDNLSSASLNSDLFSKLNKAAIFILIPFLCHILGWTSRQKEHTENSPLPPPGWGTRHGRILTQSSRRPRGRERGDPSTTRKSSAVRLSGVTFDLQLPRVEAQFLYL